MKEEEITSYTKYEKARILGSRALQIAMGAPILVKLTDNDLKRLHYNPIEIAKLEFEKDLIPITVKRPLPEKKAEQ
jgi:DNA-directed RNA polymerase subunit K